MGEVDPEACAGFMVGGTGACPLVCGAGSCLSGGQSCCRKGDPFQGPKLGSCLTLGKELSEETHADKVRDFIGKGTCVESSRVREPRRTALPCGLQSRVLW